MRGIFQNREHTEIKQASWAERIVNTRCGHSEFISLLQLLFH